MEESMNKTKLGIIIIVVVAGGLATWSLTKKDTKQQDNAVQTTQTANSETTAEQSSETPSFDPKATKDRAFVATLEGTSSNNVVLTGTIESDGKGTVHFSGTQAGDSVEYYLDASQAFIFCQEGKCYRYGANQSGLNIGDYEVSDEDIAKYKESATYVGTESCTTGTCEVWQYKDEEQTDTKIYINKNTKLVSEVVGTKDGDTFKVVYEFKDVTVTLPTDVQEITGSFEQGQ